MIFENRLVNTRIAIIGSPWSLSFLYSQLGSSREGLDWWHCSPPCFYYDHRTPVSIESLSCYGPKDLAVNGLSPIRAKSRSLFFQSPPSLISPSLQELQNIFPDTIIGEDICRYRFDPIPPIPSIEFNGASLHEGIWDIMGKNYDALIFCSPYNYGLDKIILPQPVQNISSYPIYCSKIDSQSFQLHRSPPSLSQSLRWKVWGQEEWTEAWADSGTHRMAIGIWKVETPFNAPKFLNKKKIFESFIKKIAYFSRQKPIRVR